MVLHRLGCIWIFLCLAVAAPAYAGTAVIDFEAHVGLLTDQTPANSLIAQGGKGVFLGPGMTNNFVFLEQNDARIVSTDPDEVSITITLHPAVDAVNGLCMFIADASNPNDAILACIGPDTSIATLQDVFLNFRNLSIPFPNASNNQFTLTYNGFTERATLSRPGGFEVSLEAALDGAQTYVVGLFADGEAALSHAVFTGPAIPNFPPPVDANNIFLDFTAGQNGNGAESFPYNSLPDALGAVSGGGQVNISPGASAETATVNQDVTLANADPGGGSVIIGSTSARLAGAVTRVGFVAGARDLGAHATEE